MEASPEKGLINCTWCNGIAAETVRVETETTIDHICDDCIYALLDAVSGRGFGGTVSDALLGPVIAKTDFPAVQVDTSQV